MGLGPTVVAGSLRRDRCWSAVLDPFVGMPMSAKRYRVEPVRASGAGDAEPAQ